MNTTASHTTAPDLTIYRVAEVRGQWLEAWSQGCRQFDLGDVAEIDSAGVQLLASLRRLGREHGSPIALVNPSPCVESLAREMNVAWLRAGAAA